ncbi:MAG: leucyl aminopeptidase [candidate division KSB1 bacterium]|nr:leucyl aminopeptidase [candidate division KSB1 bacterium]MDZ7303895.1 leucyl aminopeptidase [candidate division KSB1 bacterium]MDZ7313181.1 leucyl aminopeptidase [candidate division KSB1 bacterium]
MEIKIRVGKLETEKSPALALFLPKAIPAGDHPSAGFVDQTIYSSLIARPYRQKDFSGKLKETSWLYPPEGGAERLLLVGLGEWDRRTPEEHEARQNAQLAVAHAVQAAQQLAVDELHLGLDGPLVERLGYRPAAQLAAEALLLSNYRFLKYKSTALDKDKPLRRATLLISDPQHEAEVKEGARIGQIIGAWTCFARDLQNTPSNDLTPARLAEIATEKAAEFGISCRVYDEKGIRELGMGALLGVGQGSINPPRFIVLEYKPSFISSREEGPIVLVGKGITFDSGGLSIKTSDGMEEMKFDMSGAATVLATLCALAQLQLPLHVVGLIPAAENMPSGSALRPGDIIRACNGKTIEVMDTDAEGRLILADALAYAHRYEPAAVIDLATLTGAISVALGPTAAGLFGNDAALINRIKKAAEHTGERVWEMPLFPEFFEVMKSEVADIRNASDKPTGGGASKGAAFLATFAEGYKWAHLDIAGVAHPREDKPLVPKGGAGWGVRLLLQFCRKWLE